MTPRPMISTSCSQEACVSDQPARAESCTVLIDAKADAAATTGRRGHRRGGRSLSLLFPADDGCGGKNGCPPNNCRAYFAIDGDSDCSSFSGSDSEDSPDDGEIADLACDGLELSDLYSFDAELVATALRNGASFSDLRDTVQEALTDAFERRLQEEMLAPEQESVGDDAAGAPERACLDEDLSGRMTPGRATPPEGTVVDAATDPELLLNAVRAAAAARGSASRRGSYMRASRSSIAGSRKSIAGASRRVSLSRATEVVGLVQASSADVAAGGVELVQNAIEEARQRHRNSISNVMKQLGVQSSDGMAQTATPSSTCSTMSVVTDDALSSAAASAPEFEDELTVLLRERIKVAMAGALARQKQRQAEDEAEAAANAAKQRNRWSAQAPHIGYYSNHAAAAASAAAAHRYRMCSIDWFRFPMVSLPFGWVVPHQWGTHGSYYQPPQQAPCTLNGTNGSYYQPPQQAPCTPNGMTGSRRCCGVPTTAESLHF